MKKTLVLLGLGFFLLALTACSSSEDTARTDTPTAPVDEDHDNDAITDDYTYTLPVIFHVLYQNQQDTTQYVRASRLRELLTYVNEIYQGNIYGASENINVKFKAAEYDENGKKLDTPGVVYQKYSGTYPIDFDAFMSDNTGANVSYIWDPNDYINVLIYPFKSDENSKTETLGISHMPYAVKSDTALAGLNTTQIPTIKKSNLKYAHCVSINGKYLFIQSSRYTQADKGRGKQGYTYNSLDVVATLAHELGHYLGLHHMFSEDVDNQRAMLDSCADTDFCDDTPSYNRVAYSAALTEYLKNTNSEDVDFNKLLQRENCAGDDFYSANIMDYSIGLVYKISADQKKRMRWVVNNSPLMPGPKKTTTTSTRAVADGPIDLPVQIAK